MKSYLDHLKDAFPNQTSGRIELTASRLLVEFNEHTEAISSLLANTKKNLQKALTNPNTTVCELIAWRKDIIKLEEMKQLLAEEKFRFFPEPAEVKPTNV